MLTKEALKNLLHQTGLTKTEKLLLCLAADGDKAKSIAQIKEIAKVAGLQSAKTWNISAFLSASGGKAIHTDTGWELTAKGKEVVTRLAGPHIVAAPPQFAISLRTHLKKIQDQQTAEFVQEAISCFESKLFRAAVVLSWIGAVSLLYEYVIKHKLAAFNAEAKLRNQKWKEAKTRDDLARMKEHDFLQIIETVSVVGKNVREELEGCLKLRNACGHPSSLRVGEHRVSAHIEVLILNVFSRFAV